MKPSSRGLCRTEESPSTGTTGSWTGVASGRCVMSSTTTTTAKQAGLCHASLEGLGSGDAEDLQITVEARPAIDTPGADEGRKTWVGV